MSLEKLQYSVNKYEIQQVTENLKKKHPFLT